jgi:hypothetical protein
MEFSSPELIHALMAVCGDAVPVRVRSSGVDAAQSAHRGRGAHCKCGRCPKCLDNERWERIFAEKFADPNYYTRRTIHAASPLTSL